MYFLQQNACLKRLFRDIEKWNKYVDLKCGKEFIEICLYNGFFSKNCKLTICSKYLLLNRHVFAFAFKYTVCPSFQPEKCQVNILVLILFNLIPSLLNPVPLECYKVPSSFVEVGPST